MINQSDLNKLTDLLVSVIYLILIKKLIDSYPLRTYYNTTHSPAEQQYRVVEVAAESGAARVRKHSEVAVNTGVDATYLCL